MKEDLVKWVIFEFYSGKTVQMSGEDYCNLSIIEVDEYIERELQK